MKNLPQFLWYNGHMQVSLLLQRIKYIYLTLFKRRTLSLWVLFLLCGIPSHAWAADGANTLQDKLDEINKKIQSYGNLVNQTKQQQTVLSKEITSLEASATILEQKIHANKEQIQSLDTTITDLEHSIGDKEKLVTAQKNLLKELMRSFYENGGTREKFQIILSVDESSSLMQQEDWTIATGQKIQTILDNIRFAKASLSAQYNDLTQKKQAMDTLQAQLTQRSDYLDSTKRSKEYLAQKAQQQEKKYTNIIDDLQEKRDEIENELNQLDAGKVDQLDLSTLPDFKKSTLYFPVISPKKSQGYGKATWTRQYSFHNGIDFADKVGTPILAADDGKVLAVGNNGKYAYGKWIAIDHGNGLVTLYGHLSSQQVSKGKSVKRGEKIGLMGSTGYSTGSHVHFTVFAKSSFEIVPSAKVSGLLLPTGAHVNPEKYLP